MVWQLFFISQTLTPFSNHGDVTSPRSELLDVQEADAVGELQIAEVPKFWESVK